MCTGKRKQTKPHCNEISKTMSGFVRSWNQRLERVYDGANRADFQTKNVLFPSEQTLDVQRAVIGGLISKMEASLVEMNKFNMPQSNPLEDGQASLSSVQPQGYQYFKIEIPRGLKKSVLIELDAIVGDPDLVCSFHFTWHLDIVCQFVCTQEFPSQDRSTWKSAGDGDDSSKL